MRLGCSKYRVRSFIKIKIAKCTGWVKVEFVFRVIAVSSLQMWTIPTKQGITFQRLSFQKASKYTYLKTYVLCGDYVVCIGNTAAWHSFSGVKSILASIHFGLVNTCCAFASDTCLFNIRKAFIIASLGMFSASS